jgi:ribose 5-phosphate isomerase A
MKDANSMSEYKREAALKAAALITPGQVVGLGTGSTTAFVIEELGRRVREEQLKILCVVTSFSSLFLAREAGLSVAPLHQFSELDISIDGADEIDSALNLIKGGGGAHTLEKIVHAMSRRFIVVADHTKKVQQLGSKFPVPVEVIPEAMSLVKKRLLAMNAKSVDLRTGVNKDGPIVTDNGNFLLDARFYIEDAEELEREINTIPGVVENGIFSLISVRMERAFVGGLEGVEEISL